MEEAMDEVLRSIADGDLKALQTLYEEFRVPVYSIALSIVRDKSWAEDIVQETFIRIYTKATSYTRGTSPKAWVISIARNLAYDLLRENNRRQAYVQHFNGPTTATDSEVNIVDRVELVQALFQLGEIERQIVVLHVVAGLTHQEISDQLGLAPGTVRWKYRQALKRLSQLIGRCADEIEPCCSYIQTET